MVVVSTVEASRIRYAQQLRLEAEDRLRRARSRYLWVLCAQTAAFVALAFQASTHQPSPHEALDYRMLGLSLAAGSFLVTVLLLWRRRQEGAARFDRVAKMAWRLSMGMFVLLMGMFLVFISRDVWPRNPATVSYMLTIIVWTVHGNFAASVAKAARPLVASTDMDDVFS